MWTPGKSQPLSDKETLGRRLFGKEIINQETTAKGRAGAVRIDHFIETRSGCNLSVDRLGVNNPDQDVLDQVAHLSEKHSKTLEKMFAGWAIFVAKHAMSAPHSLEIKPTPKDDNKYHADVILSQADKIQRNRVAFALATISNFHPYAKQTGTNSSSNDTKGSSWLSKLIAIFR
jgi:hypothetical protein